MPSRAPSSVVTIGDSNSLMLLAVAHTGNVEITSQPHEMMRIANGYALAGLPRLIAILNGRGGDTALDHLSDAVSELTRE